MTRIGTTFKTVFARMSNVKLGKLEDEDGNSISTELNDVEKILNRIGVPLRKNATEWNDFGGVLDQIAVKWKTISGVEQSAIATALGGVRQKEAVLTMLENYDKVLQYEKVATESSGTALEKFNNAWLGSIEAKTNAFKASFESLSMSIINSGLIKALTDMGRGVLDLLNGTDKLIPTWARFALVIVAVGIAFKNTAIMSALSSLKAIGTTIAMSGLRDVIWGVGLALKEATVSMLAFLATNPVGWAVFAAGAIFGINKFVDFAAKHMERLNTAMKESSDAVKSAQDEIDKVNSEIETTQTRMAELEAIKSPTLIEQEELTKLKKSNDALLLQIGYLKAKADILKQESKKDVQEAEQAVNPYSSRQENWQAVTFMGKSSYDIYDRKTDIVGNYKSALQEIEMLTAKGDTATNKEKKRLKLLGDETLKYKNRLMEYYEAYSGIYDFYGDTDPKGQAAYTQMQAIMDVFGQSTSVAEQYLAVMEKYPSVTDSLTSMAMAGNLNSTSVDRLLSQNPELSASLEKLGIDSEQLIAEFLASASAMDEAGTSASELKTSLDSLSSTQGLLKSISTEMKDSGAIGMGNLTTLIETYPQLSAVVAKYLTGVASAKDVYSALQGVYDENLKASKDMLISQLSNDAEFYKSLGINYTTYRDDMGINRTIDLTNCKNLADSKRTIEKNLLNDLGNWWSQYYNIQSQTFTTAYVDAINSINRGAREKGLPYSNEARDQALEVAAALKKATGIYSSITDGVDFKNIGASFSDTDKNGGTDKNKAAFDKSYASLKGQLEREQITKKQYADKLESLTKKHFSNLEKYTSEHEQYETEVYNSRKEFLKESFDTEQKLLEDRLKRNEISQSQYGIGLAKINDTYLKNSKSLEEEYSKTLADVYASNQEVLKGKQEAIQKIVDTTVEMIKQELEDEKSILEDRKDAYDESIDVQKTALEKSRDDQKEALEDRKDSLNDYYDLQLDLIEKSGEAQKDALETKIKAIDDGIDAEIEALQRGEEADTKALETKKSNFDDYINARKDALTEARNQDQYSSELGDKQSNIDKINFQISSMSGDTSNEGQRRRLELQDELKKAQKEMSGYVSDHDYETQIGILDKAQEAETKKIDAEIAILKDKVTAQVRALEDTKKLQDEMLAVEMKNLENNIASQKEALELAKQQQLDAIDLQIRDIDRRVTDQIAALDAMQKIEDAKIEAQIKVIDKQLESEGLLINEAYTRMNGMNKTLYNELIAYNNRYGTGIKNDIIDQWKLANDAVKAYSSSLDGLSAMVTISSQVAQPQGYATGTYSLPYSGVVEHSENNRQEAVFNAINNGSQYEFLNKKSLIATASQTDQLREFLSSPSAFIKKSISGITGNGLNGIINNNINNSPMEVQVANTFHISGTDPEGISAVITKMLPQIQAYTMNGLNNTLFRKGHRLTAGNMQ